MKKQEITFREFKKGDKVPRNIERVEPEYLQDYINFEQDVVVEMTKNGVTIYPKYRAPQTTPIFTLRANVLNTEVDIAGAPTAVINKPVFNLN